MMLLTKGAMEVAMAASARQLSLSPGLEVVVVDDWTMEDVREYANPVLEHKMTDAEVRHTLCRMISRPPEPDWGWLHGLLPTRVREAWPKDVSNQPRIYQEYEKVQGQGR